MSALSKAEKSYICTSLLSDPPLRGDGRSLTEYRNIALETGVSPLGNGSARLKLGHNAHDGGGGTEILAASKLEVEDVEEGDGVEGGRLIFTVTCSPAAYSNLSSTALDEQSHDWSQILQSTLGHSSLHPNNLNIIPGKKSWLLAVDLVVLSDAGNVLDALFMAARSVLWDTKVPRTRSVQYKAQRGATGVMSERAGDMDLDRESKSGFDTRDLARPTDFELPDYWDEGEVLDGQTRWPISVTMNLLSPIHYLDATTAEEISTPLKVLILYSFASKQIPQLQGVQLLGPGEISPSILETLLTESTAYATRINQAINNQLVEEDARRFQKARDLFASRR